MKTTQDIIKIVPLNKDFKDELLSKFDTLTPDQKYGIERLIWNYYDALYEAKVQENMQLAFDRAKKNEEKLDDTFYERIRKLTEQELTEEYSKTETTVELLDTREALQKILNQTKN